MNKCKYFLMIAMFLVGVTPVYAGGMESSETQMDSGYGDEMDALEREMIEAELAAAEAAWSFEDEMEDAGTVSEEELPKQEENWDWSQEESWEIEEEVIGTSLDEPAAVVNSAPSRVQTPEVPKIMKTPAVYSAPAPIKKMKETPAIVSDSVEKSVVEMAEPETTVTGEDVVEEMGVSMSSRQEAPEIDLELSEEDFSDEISNMDADADLDEDSGDEKPKSKMFTNNTERNWAEDIYAERLSTNTRYQKNYFEELGTSYERGIVNALTFPLEIPQTIQRHDEAAEQRPVIRHIAGFVDGTFRALTRATSVVWDLTFGLVPGNQENHVLSPDTIT